MISTIWHTGDTKGEIEMNHVMKESLSLGMSKVSERKIVIIFLPISFNIFWGAQKNRLNETVLLSTHNICFC